MTLYSAPFPISNTVRGRASSTDTSDVTLIAAPNDGSRLMITRLVIDNSHATTKTGVLLKSGSTTIWGPIPAPAAGGAIVPIDPPLECNPNEAFKFASVDSVTTISVSAIGYRA